MELVIAKQIKKTVSEKDFALRAYKRYIILFMLLFG
jgi:hypothetical protein